jgi:hypothetical protein
MDTPLDDGICIISPRDMNYTEYIREYYGISPTSSDNTSVICKIGPATVNPTLPGV